MLFPETRERAEAFARDLSRFPSIRPLSTSQQRGWPGIDAYIGVIERGDVFSFTCPNHSVNFHLQDGVRVRWRCSEHDRTEQCGPGSITIVPAGEHRFEVSGPCQFLSWTLDPDRLETVAGEHAIGSDGSGELQPLFAGHDPALWTLGEALTRELDHPGLASGLYAESLEMGLIVQLLRRYSHAGAQEPPSRGKLPASRLRAARDFIHQNLDRDISLLTLADAVGMSPYHFAKLFKRSTGRSPHRYVLEQRVEKARRLLEKGNVPIAAVALSVGFCSQSHLTEVFRRLVGVTPAVYQKSCGGQTRTMPRT
jgi:AraC family transcriptional regulator